MAILRRRRWTATLLAAAVAVTTGVVTVRAEDDPALPPVDARELLASTIEAASRPVTISGDVTTTLDLGIPQLPTTAGGAGLPGALATLTGDQRWRVWSAPDGLRVAHLLQVREQDLVVNAADAWWWDSADLTAVHLDLEGTHLSSDDAGGSPMSAVDPVDLAGELIRAVAPCASVSVQGTDRVAGRDAYVLALTPLSSGSLVGSVRVSIDADLRLPLRLEVRSADGEDTPLAAGFTSVSFEPIDPTMFTFEPPPGATVRDAGDEASGGEASGAAPSGSEGGDGAPAPADVTDVRTFGTCAGVVVAVRVEGPVPETGGLLPLAGPLASVRVADRGDHAWVLAGLVDAEELEARAATLP